MAESIRDLLFGAASSGRGLVEVTDPRRTFDDVVLPRTTLHSLNHALALVRKHDLIFHQWGLAERHSTGLGLAFHFAGAPGTGKTVCAEALAHALAKRLLVVRYAELESRWVGQTAKHVASVFQLAEREDAVLFFDEADAIAARRFTNVTAAYEREANAIVNVLLHELESFPGIVIFATNLAANIDPAFERRIRTHILFEMPDAEARERIWKVQIHARKTPLADDVDFRALAERYPRSGGDIKNAVLKAAQLATVEPGPDSQKRIYQRHFIQGMEEVVAAQSVMSQSLFAAPDLVEAATAMDRMAEAQDQLQGELGLVAERLEGLEAGLAELQARQIAAIAAGEAAERERKELGRTLERAASEAGAASGAVARRALWLGAAALIASLGALAAALLR